MSQDDDHEQALEVAAATVHIDHTIEVRRARDFARTAVTAYLHARAGASRRSEMDAENKRLREALHKIADRPTAVGVNPQGLVDYARAALEHQQKGEGL